MNALPLGEVFCTMGALHALAQALDEEPNTFLARHANAKGDGGEVNEHDRQANEYALEHGLRVLSAYTLTSGQRIWVITEAERSSATMLLPEEY